MAAKPSWAGKYGNGSGSFHMVWRTPAGDLRDVTPKALPFQQILFVPDVKHAYTGQQINNVRQSLTDDARVHQFIGLANRVFDITNAGDLATFHGQLPSNVAREVMTLELEKARLFDAIMRSEPSRNDLCRCGSGKKYKRCHRP